MSRTASLLWSAVQNNRQAPTSQISIPPQITPQNPNATALRLLLTKTESSLENLSSNVETLIREASASKSAVLALTQTHELKLAEVREQLTSEVNTSSLYVRDSLGSLEPLLQSIATRQQLFEEKLLRIESEIFRDREEAAKQRQSEQTLIQLQLQTIVNQTNELRIEMARLSQQIVPDIQAIPLHIQSSANELANKLLLRVFHRVHYSPSRHLVAELSDTSPVPPMVSVSQESERQTLPEAVRPEGDRGQVPSGEQETNLALASHEVTQQPAIAPPSLPNTASSEHHTRSDPSTHVNPPNIHFITTSNSSVQGESGLKTDYGVGNGLSAKKATQNTCRTNYSPKDTTPGTPTRPLRTSLMRRANSSPPQRPLTRQDSGNHLTTVATSSARNPLKRPIHEPSLFHKQGMESRSSTTRSSSPLREACSPVQLQLSAKKRRVSFKAPFSSPSLR